MSLEIQTGKVPGTEIRRTPAERPAFVGLLIVAMTLVEFLFVVLIFWAIGSGANNASAHDPAIPNGTINLGFVQFEFFNNEQVIISFWLACAFFCLWYILFLYQRFFLDHVTIAKRRFRKWEDEGVQLHG